MIKSYKVSQNDISSKGDTAVHSGMVQNESFFECH